MIQMVCMASFVRLPGVTCRIMNHVPPPLPIGAHIICVDLRSSRRTRRVVKSLYSFGQPALSPPHIPRLSPSPNFHLPRISFFHVFRVFRG